MANSTDTLNNLTLSTVVTDADLLALCEHLLVCENGEPWAGDAAKQRSTQLQKLRAYLVAIVLASRCRSSWRSRYREKHKAACPLSSEWLHAESQAASESGEN